MKEQDEIIFREFVKDLTQEETELLIEAYQNLADKLKPLANGKWRKIGKK